MPLCPDSDSDARAAQYWGLAPFLRTSIEGGDLRRLGEAVLAGLARDPESPNRLLNAANLMQCLEQTELGLEFQAEALARTATYRIPARRQPALLRLLVLLAPGDLQCNTPIECLLEDSDIDLVFHYVLQLPLRPAQLPAHDVLMVGIGDSDALRPLLMGLVDTLATWPQPVINAPQYLPRTGREVASALLRDIARLVVPQTHRVALTALLRVAQGSMALAQLVPGMAFPVILRPVGSQGGRGLERIDSAAGLTDYLGRTGEVAFYIAPFVDYRDSQGHYKKIRIALIDAQPYVCHMAVSTEWMVHYVNAGMYEHAPRRAQEAQFMAQFDQFAARHQSALQAMTARLELDYLIMDCAETPDGALLLFEIDNVGVVHDMDEDRLFPYKKTSMDLVRQAFRRALLRRHHAHCEGQPACPPSIA